MTSTLLLGVADVADTVASDSQADHSYHVADDVADDGGKAAAVAAVVETASLPVLDKTP